MSNLDALHAKVDRFSAQIDARYAAHVRCGAGCSGCCQRTLSLLPVELERVLASVAALDASHKAQIRSRLDAPGETCPLLLEERCAVYASRPTICRSHGLPVRVTGPNGEPRRDVCPLNFEGSVSVDDLPAVDVLDVERLNQILVVVDRLTPSTHRPNREGGRIGLRGALLAQLASPPEGPE